MPGLVDGDRGGKKRKRESERILSANSKRRAIDHDAADDDPQAQILLLENQVLDSRRHYNNIATLIAIVKEPNPRQERDIVAAVALCRIFSRLVAAGNLSKTKNGAASEVVIVDWLKERQKEYTEALLGLLEHANPARRSTALTLILRSLKDEAVYMNPGEESIWRTGSFPKLIGTLLGAKVGQEIRVEFVEKYVEEYDDIRYYTFTNVGSVAAGAVSGMVDNALSILSMIENVPKSKDELKDFYLEPPKKSKHPLHSLTNHKKQAQEAWLTILRSGLSNVQRKVVLGLISHRIAPWFVKIELLMDFLTDSYNQGGSTSLLALSGLFYLIREKNLDYPSFYSKLYSLLNSGVLHSKHRSRFFRLLETFLASTHLPAALVASFIKRLSRLTLHAPPAGIVVVIPWVYNLLKEHPACTFMIHRERQGEEANKLLRDRGMDDPFNMEEADPMQTNAIESSLWEIEMLQSHYHPNVATLAKIISEQFTKQAYNLEDFLDHSYGSMLDAELSKDIKKAPVIEYEIPKRIFMEHDVDAPQQDCLLVKLWDFS
ncbi:MAG: hypothetical protein M1830_004200 [Pleopsidium flavum]|nr:MAG: hypothetical protein M1830_004200 [Pleopsidium flavum]